MAGTSQIALIESGRKQQTHKDAPMSARDFRPEVLHAFGAPIIALDIPDHSRINAGLSEVIVDRRSAMADC
jgi:hypothetical protein